VATEFKVRVRQLGPPPGIRQANGGPAKTDGPRLLWAAVHLPGVAIASGAKLSADAISRR
jgi:hypothetical protein